MDVEPSSPNKDDSEDSGDNLEIVIENETRKKKKFPVPTESEKLIIESIEDELERRLEEKATKTNLNAVHVKNIIKHVVTNEHVLYLIRNVENPLPEGERISPMFEPKLTRSKAKELCSTLERPPLPSVSWASSPKHSSEVESLLKDDLQEDSSGDDYVPGVGDEEGENESEDGDSSFFSDPPSVEPPTPPSAPCCSDSGTQTNWADDGIFKIPLLPKDKEETTDEANIALRTRSKLCLSSTPLEEIEKAFMPPDITTDMYEMDCDNEDWMNFLKTFTQPLDEIVKAPEVEEEELDPEYNVLADEEIDKPDREELRVDKAVKVSRKELNSLMAELYEFCTNEQAYLDTIEEDDERGGNQFSISQVTENTLENSCLDSTAASVDMMANEKSKCDNTDTNVQTTVISEVINETNSLKKSDLFTEIQICLLEQQMRQHVQMLTQNFLLTYQNPELHEHSKQMKEYLLNLKFLARDKRRSLFCAINLGKAVDLTTYWENLVASGTNEVKEMMCHIEKVISESLRNKQTGNEYIVTFPTLILETISKSDVFLYPSLLPKIPFKSPRYFTSKLIKFTESEVQLIAIGLEEFVPVAEEQIRTRLDKKKELEIVADYIHEYMLPIKKPHEIYSKIVRNNFTRCANNPIKQYFISKKAPTCIQYVISLDEMKILPPCQRKPEELPHQWKNYLYPPLPPPPQAKNPSNILPLTTFMVKPYPGIQLTPIPIQTNNIQKPLFSKGPVSSTPVCPRRRVSRIKRVSRRQTLIKTTEYFNEDPITKFVKCLGQPSPISKVLELFSFNSIFDNSEDLSLIFAEYVNNKQAKPEEKCVNAHDISEKSKIFGGSNLLKDNSVILNKSNPKLKNIRQNLLEEAAMLPNMPSLLTPLLKVESENGKQVAQEKSNSLKKDISLEISQVGITSFSSSSSFNLSEKSTDFSSKSLITPEKKDDTPKKTRTLSKSSEKIDESPKARKTSSKLTNTEIKADVTSKDSQEDINALLIASSTVKPPANKVLSGAEKKRAKIRKEYLANLSLCTPEDREVEKQKNEMFALAYYDKMRETLEIDSYHKIMQILNDYEEGDAVDLYHKIEGILRPKYEDLADEFLLFLREREAAAVGRLVPWIKMNNKSKFLRKLEIHFKDQPAQLKKIYQCLTELSQTVGVTMEKIKTTLLPMFKGNTLLTDLFLQNFMDEPPPSSLMDGPWETIEVNKELSRPDEEEPFETIVVPDVDDKYGGHFCICSCHEIEDAEFKSRFRHCTRCGTKFINGKVYMQTGQGLRLARVSFLTNPNMDHHARLEDKDSINFLKRRKKRSESSPSKTSTSTTKDNDEDSDEDGEKKKKPKRKPPQRRNRKEKVQEDSTVKETRKTPSKGKPAKEKPANPRKRTNSIKKTTPVVKLEHIETGPEEHNEVEVESHNETEMESHNETELEEPNEIEIEHTEVDIEENIDVEKDGCALKPGASVGQKKRLHEESCEEGEHSAANESSGEIKIGSPGHHTADSESEFLEESSQDNCESDSNSSTPSTAKSYAEVLEQNSSWKREEDKIILEVFQSENDKDHAFRAIANQLSNRTVDEIKSRFETLMDLLMKTVEDHRD